MPSTLSGLLIFVYVLIPGYCYYAARRRLTPTRRVTTIVDAANVIFVAMVTNAVMLVIFGVTQVVPWIREHSPSAVHLLRDSSEYLLQQQFPIGISSGMVDGLTGWFVCSCYSLSGQKCS